MTAPDQLKIVSLLPSATEIIDCLGLTSALVGRSHECDYPPSVKDLPVCTAARLNSDNKSSQIDKDVQTLLQEALSIYKIKTEVLEQLRPTHIVTQDQCDVCAVNFAEVEKAIAQLTKSSPQVISLQPNLLQFVWQDIERVAQTLGVESQPVLSQLQARIDAITQKVKPQESLPTVVALEWTEPLMGGGNWIPELIEIAGGKPLLGVKGEHSPYLSWSSLTEANPDVIVIMPCGFDLERTEQESQVLMSDPDWSNLKAVKNGKVFIVDGNAYFNRPGPRLVDSAEILAEILHPELFDFGYQGKSWKPLMESNKLNDTELINQLKSASEGLLWLSESDYPFKTIYWENVDDIEAKLLEVTNSKGHTKIEVRELERFFNRVTEEKDWYEDKEIAECKRYQALVNLLKTHLTDIKVYRVGSCEVNCYILGKTASGAIAGLSTISVET